MGTRGFGVRSNHRNPSSSLEPLTNLTSYWGSGLGHVTTRPIKPALHLGVFPWSRGAGQLRVCVLFVFVCVCVWLICAAPLFSLASSAMLPRNGTGGPGVC